jgi:Bacteriophage related domain of unknown function
VSAIVDSQIFNALANALDAYVVANPVAVAYPGLSFVPVPGQPYLRPWLLPAPTITTDWARSNDFSGIFQIDVFWPAGQGIKPAMAAAAQIVDYFAGGTPYAGTDIAVQVNEAPYLSPAQQEPGWLQIPVNVRYRAFASAPGLLIAALAAVGSADVAAFAGTVS